MVFREEWEKEQKRVNKNSQDEDGTLPEYITQETEAVVSVWQIRLFLLSLEHIFVIIIIWSTIYYEFNKLLWECKNSKQKEVYFVWYKYKLGSEYPSGEFPYSASAPSTEFRTTQACSDERCMSCQNIDAEVPADSTTGYPQCDACFKYINFYEDAK